MPFATVSGVHVVHSGDLCNQIVGVIMETKVLFLSLISTKIATQQGHLISNPLFTLPFVT